MEGGLDGSGIHLVRIDDFNGIYSNHDLRSVGKHEAFQR